MEENNTKNEHTEIREQSNTQINEKIRKKKPNHLIVILVVLVIIGCIAGYFILDINYNKNSGNNNVNENSNNTNENSNNNENNNNANSNTDEDKDEFEEEDGGTIRIVNTYSVGFGRYSITRVVLSNGEVYKFSNPWSKDGEGSNLKIVHNPTMELEGKISNVKTWCGGYVLKNDNSVYVENFSSTSEKEVIKNVKKCVPVSRYISYVETFDNKVYQLGMTGAYVNGQWNDGAPYSTTLIPNISNLISIGNLSVVTYKIITKNGIFQKDADAIKFSKISDITNAIMVGTRTVLTEDGKVYYDIADDSYNGKLKKLTLINEISNVKNIYETVDILYLTTNNGEVYTFNFSKKALKKIDGIKDASNFYQGFSVPYILTSTGKIYSIDYSANSAGDIKGLEDIKYLSLSTEKGIYFDNIYAVNGNGQVYFWSNAVGSDVPKLMGEISALKNK